MVFLSHLPWLQVFMDMAWDMDIKAVFRIRIHVILGHPDPLFRGMDPDPDPALDPDPDTSIIQQI
jgi:hypothetical protein